MYCCVILMALLDKQSIPNVKGYRENIISSKCSNFPFRKIYFLLNRQRCVGFKLGSCPLGNGWSFDGI